MLLNVIEHLPRHSYFIEAYADDDEVAEAVGTSQGPRVERLSDWTPEREALAELVDRMGSLISVLMQVNGNKAPAIPAFPRPHLAAHRLAERETRALHDRLHERLYGQQYDPEGG